MGVLYANFEDAIKNIDQCLDAKGWDDINLEFGLDEYYLCDYTQENIDRLCSMIDHNSNYWNQVTDDPRIFLPLEVVQVLYDEYGVNFFKNDNINSGIELQRFTLSEKKEIWQRNRRSWRRNRLHCR